MEKVLYEDSETPGAFILFCPGCKCGHMVHTITPNMNGAKWSFNGDMEKPTFRASLLVTQEFLDGRPKHICHSYITDGNIQFLGDCTHNLKGQTVPLQKF